MNFAGVLVELDTATGGWLLHIPCQVQTGTCWTWTVRPDSKDSISWFIQEYADHLRISHDKVLV